MDRVGILFELYRYSQIAYVGGGFGKGVHNVLEPAAFGLPVLFGPRHQASAPAQALLEADGGLCIYDSAQLRNPLHTLLTNPSTHQSHADSARHLVESHAGATERTLHFLHSRIPTLRPR